MAEQVLKKTRIQLRRATTAEWETYKDVVPTAGEPCFDLELNTLKIGDGTHKYSELDFVYAKAADVVAACKSEYTLTAFVNNIISNAGIATNEALTTLAGRVTTAEGEIDALQGLVGETAVPTQITSAINDLKNGDIKSATDRIAALESDTHTHDNKTLLDTYTQTEADLADAVAKKHEHANKTELDKIADGDKAKWDAAVQTITVGTGLTAAKTGTDVAIGFDDSVTFIFDCGDSVE